MEEVQAYIRVYGIVQGVGYRFFTERHARRLGLKGYVRNMPDGSVEVVVEGSKDKIETLIKYLKRGPYLARVEKVVVEYRKPTGKFSDFTIKYW